MLVLFVLVVLAITAMSGLFGARDGAYRKRGIVVGSALIVLAAALFLAGLVR